MPAPKHFYDEFFKDIVGVSHMKDAEKEHIVIRAHSLYIYKLFPRKVRPFLQEVVTPFGEHEDGIYGDFSLQVKVNNEFIGRILQMGAGLEIISPDNVRQMFKERVAELAKLYTK